MPSAMEGIAQVFRRIDKRKKTTLFWGVLDWSEHDRLDSVSADGSFLNLHHYETAVFSTAAFVRKTIQKRARQLNLRSVEWEPTDWE